MQIAIQNINSRVMEKAEAKQEVEKLKLEICKKCLASEVLERRILGIKELNSIIKSVQTVTGTVQRVLTIEFLIEWMSAHGVFDILWDPKKTHL